MSVIVPTRNEVGNIEPLLARLQDALASIDAEVLVVDDSDDATSELARQVAARSALPIRVHARPPGQRVGGLGGAVHVGFSEALAPVCVVMDADLQHPPELLETLLGVSRTGADFVIASRYVDGGGDEGLGGWYRHAVSMLATWAAKRVLRPELAGISDPMSGFFLVRRSCLDLPGLHPQGFKLLLELLAHHPRATVAEVPYTFEARHSGASKADFKEGFTYLRRLAGLRAEARRASQRPRRRLVPAACGASATARQLSQRLPTPRVHRARRHLLAVLAESGHVSGTVAVWKRDPPAAAVGPAPGFRPMEARWNGLLPCWLAVEQDWDLARSAPSSYGGWIMRCPQCGAETPDEEWNCVSCRMNVYWASQHYRDLAAIRQQQGLHATPDTPSFLVQAHASAMEERAERGGKVEHKVRQIARRAMSQEGRDLASVQAQTPGGPDTAAEPGRRRPETRLSSSASGPVRSQPKEAT